MTVLYISASYCMIAEQAVCSGENDILGDIMLNSKNYLTPKQVSELLMVSTSAIRSMVEKGELKALVTAGGHRRYKLDDIREFAQNRNISLNIDTPVESPLPASINAITSMPTSGPKKDASIKILIVDDDMSYAMFLKSVIELASKTVAVAISLDGFDAGMQFRDFSPDIVLLDLYMPNLDGFAVCQQIRKDPLNHHVRIMAMTAEKTKTNAREILAAGAEVCIEKSFDTTSLLQLLELPCPVFID